MTTSTDIEAQNQIALDKRNAIWKDNPHPVFGISELAKMPPYFGLVDAKIFHDLKFVMFLSNNDDGVALRWLWNGRYEPMSLGMWSELARQSSVIFDIGAHTGVYSIAAGFANSKATIVACEPYDLNYARLLVNLRVNRLSRATAYPVAISDQDGAVPFSVSTGSWYLSTGGSVGVRQQGTTRSVPAMKLDTIFQQNGGNISLVKIDTEGHELAVVRGAQNVLRTCMPDILMESVFDKVTGEIEQLLMAHGYRFYLIDDDNLEVRPVKTLAPAGTADAPAMGLLNRLITRRDPQEVQGLARNVQARLIETYNAIWKRDE